MPVWRLLDTGSNPAAYNMALDEELLARAQAGDRVPVLRFYGWSPPAVSLGRFQDIAASVDRDACARLGFDVVRRVTGGRAVLHRHELTYSITARTDDPFFPSTVLGTYKVIAAGMVSALRSLGLPAEIVSRTGRNAVLVERAPKDPSCFSSPSWYEIVVNGRKIVGSAQRRAGGAFLQHGSLLIDHDPGLERQVIRGGQEPDRATSVVRELCRDPGWDRLRGAVTQGFTDALGVLFRQER